MRAENAPAQTRSCAHSFTYKVFAIKCCPIIGVNQRLSIDLGELDTGVFGEKPASGSLGSNTTN